VEVDVRVSGSLLLGLILAVLVCGPGYAFKEGSQDCGKCHTLAEKDMAPILEKVNLQGAKVLNIQMSPIKGLWEVAVENKNQRFVMYVDFSKKYITPGPFLEYANRKDITRERTDQLNKDRKIDISTLSLQNALIVGKADAPIKVVVFTDPG
jgi:thiol:disulfide interchange protein DsbC